MSVHKAYNYDQLKIQTKPIPPKRRGGYKDYWIAFDLLEFTSHGYDGHMFNGAAVLIRP